MIYQFRCELCDEYLPMLQFSKLCPKCYEIRTIVKCYDTDKILNCLKDKFKVKDEEQEKEKNQEMQPIEKSKLYIKKDGKWIKNEEAKNEESEDEVD